MNKKKLDRVIMASAFLAFSMWSLASSADRQGVEVGVGVSKFIFGDDVGVEDNEGWKVNLGYRFNSPFSIELNHAETETEISNVSTDADVSHTYLDLLYHFNSGGRVEPYIAAGYGVADVDTNFGSVDDETYDVGAGIKFYLTDRAILRPDIRFADADDLGDNHQIVSLSFSFLLGGSSSPRPAAVVPSEPKPADGDKDGVADGSDACPGTPGGAAVDTRGCPLDSDRDGVADHGDACPDTAAKLKVDTRGCPQVLTETVSIDLQVNFDSNSDVVKAEYLPEIRRVANFLEQYENTVAVIEGHTDTSGSAEYNKALSQRRADAVARVLVDQLGVSANKVRSVGYGEERPIADESTREGRLANRRVVAKISTEVEKLQEK